MYWADSVRETTVSTGTGTLTLDGAYRGHQTFLSAIGNSKSFYYCIRHRTANLWEVGIGTLSAGVTLTRVKVLAGSSGAGVAVTFTSGTSDVFLTEPATAAEGAAHLKKPCVVASLANLTISTGLNAGDTVNGVVLVAGDRVLLTAQTTASENGVYIAGVTPARAEDLFTGSQAAGVLVPVQGGTTFGDTLWLCTSAIGSDIVGTNSLTWSKVGSGTGGATGPNPSTLNSVPRWDSTDGTTLEDSELLIYPSANDKLQTNATFQAWTAAADGSTITFDFDASDKQSVTEAGSRTLAASNVSVGQRISLLRTQDGTGGRVDTWFSNISWDNALAPYQDPTAAGWDLVVLDCIGLDGYSVPQWVEVCRTSSAPRKGITTAADGATVTFDLRVSPKQSVTLGGNRTLELTASSFYVGMTFAIGIIQDGTGSRTVTWGTSFGTINWLANGGTEPTLPTTAAAECWLCFVCKTAGGSPVFNCVGASGQSPTASVSDTAYNSTTWNGVTTVAPSKNAVRDKFETLGTASTLASDTDGTLAANSDSVVATQKAVKTYVDTSVTGLLDYKGATDCSANPNYPAASKGDLYIVSVAGKIGGASGQTVEAMDVYVAKADNGGGTEASVGTSWSVIQGNVSAGFTGSGQIVKENTPTLITPVLGVASATSLACPVFTSADAITMTPTAGNNFNVVCSGAGDFTVNTTQLVVDTSSGNVGVGTTSPSALIHGIKTTEQLRLGYDASNYASHTVGSNGAYALATTGTGGAMTFTPSSGNNFKIVTGGTTAKVHLQSSSTAYIVDMASTAIGAMNNTIAVRFGYDGSTYNKGAIYFVGQDANARGNLVFALEPTANSSNVSTANAVMCLTYNGNAGFGTVEPTALIHGIKTTEQLRLGYNTTEYLSVTQGSGGTCTYDITTAGTARHVFADRVNIPTATPASASATGTTGDICWDASYIYVATATDTWKRAAIATW